MVQYPAITFGKTHQLQAWLGEGWEGKEGKGNKGQEEKGGEEGLKGFVEQGERGG